MKYKLVKSRRKTISLEIRGGELIVRAPLFTSRLAVELYIAKNEGWIQRQFQRMESERAKPGGIERLTEQELSELKKQAKTVFAERVAYYAPLVGVKPERITIRSQKTKWGSCSSKHNLNFNCLLLLAPPEVLDSVVVHELCHLKHMNHSQAFYDELLRVFPDYRRCDRWLKEHGNELMARLPL